MKTTWLTPVTSKWIGTRLRIKRGRLEVMQSTLLVLDAEIETLAEMLQYLAGGIPMGRIENRPKDLSVTFTVVEKFDLKDNGSLFSDQTLPKNQ